MTNDEITLKLNYADLALITGSITALKTIVFAGAEKYYDEKKTPDEYAAALRKIGIDDAIAAALLSDRDLEIAEKIDRALNPVPSSIPDIRYIQ